MSAACGSWRVVEYDHGYEAVVRWCERVDGPCPFKGTRASRDHPRSPCAAAEDDVCRTCGGSGRVPVGPLMGGFTDTDDCPDCQTAGIA